MLPRSLLFLVLALLMAFLALKIIAGIASFVVKALAVVFAILFVVSLFSPRKRV